MKEIFLENDHGNYILHHNKQAVGFPILVDTKRKPFKANLEFKNAVYYGGGGSAPDINFDISATFGGKNIKIENLSTTVDTLNKLIPQLTEGKASNISIKLKILGNKSVGFELA